MKLSTSSCNKKSWVINYLNFKFKNFYWPQMWLRECRQKISFLIASNSLQQTLSPIGSPCLEDLLKFQPIPFRTNGLSTRETIVISSTDRFHTAQTSLSKSNKIPFSGLSRRSQCFDQQPLEAALLRVEMQKSGNGKQEVMREVRQTPIGMAISQFVFGTVRGKLQNDNAHNLFADWSHWNGELWPHQHQLRINGNME